MLLSLVKTEIVIMKTVTYSLPFIEKFSLVCLFDLLHLDSKEKTQIIRRIVGGRNGRDPYGPVRGNKHN